MTVDEVMMRSQAGAWKETVYYIGNKDPNWYKNGDTGMEAMKNTIDKLIEDARNEGYQQGHDKGYEEGFEHGYTNGRAAGVNCP